jgi:hypothetical protein
MKTTITYEWWVGGKDDIPERHKNELNEYALYHIHFRIIAGYTSGSLSTEIDNSRYDGWWDIVESQ